MTFNEKVLHRKHFDGRKIFSTLADKYQVRSFVADRIGEQYLVPLLFCTDNPSKLHELKDWKNTAIKPNHAAGMVRIIDSEEPSQFSKDDIIRSCEAWLRADFSSVACEAHYKDIPRKILVEKLLGDGTIAPNDYKFHWFNKSSGPEWVMLVVNDRFSQRSAPSQGYYLNSFTNCVWMNGGGNHLIPEAHIPLLDHAITLNGVLAADFEYVRIDWYVHEGKLYFGELTFTPGAGRSNDLGRELDSLMGAMWPKILKHKPGMSWSS